jgi:hypothetical protein
MKREILWLARLMLFFFAILLLSIIHLTKTYRATGYIKPVAQHVAPNNEHGSIVYITKKQDLILKSLSITMFLSFISCFYLLIKSGFSLWIKNDLISRYSQKNKD